MARRLAATLVIVAIVLAASSRAAHGATGTVITRSGNGLTLTFSTQWLDGDGYRPLQVTLVPALPSKADQTVQMEFHSYQYYYPGTREIVVRQSIDIPAGSTQVFDTIALPENFAIQTCKLEVWVDNRYSNKLSMPSFAGVSGPTVEGLPKVLLVAPATTAVGPPGTSPPGTSILAADPDSSALASIFPADLTTQQQYWGVATPAAPAGTAAPLPTLITLPSNYVPKRWIELSSLDLVCIGFGDLKQLATAEPDRFRALREWTSAGGNLIVFSVGAQLEHIDELSKLIDFKPSGGSAATEWTRPRPSDYGDRLTGVPITSGTPPLALTPLAMPQEAPFRLRRSGTGMVIAAATDDLFKQPPQHWVWMLNSLGVDRWQWYRRHGLSVQRKNGDFWNWLVRGVGLAPVTEFRVLISAFVLAIGPVNYFWLRRRGKLHLLVVIVPLAALTVTLGLFGFAMVADGLDIRVRARTYTQIDQRGGQAVCWSRISYYAGMAPSGGLLFPDDVVALPLTPNDEDSSSMPMRQTMVWSDHTQRLASGWLASRTPGQFITVRSHKSEAALRFLPARGQSGPQIENGLGTRVIRLLLADDDGKHYHAVDVAAGARAALEPVEPGIEQTAMYDFVTEHQPGLPQGFVPPSGSSFRGRRRYYWAASNNSLPAAALGSSRLEIGLREAMAGADKGTSSNTAGAPLAPRSYIAIVERSPEVVFGVDNPREEDSLHVVVGSW